LGINENNPKDTIILPKIAEANAETDSKSTASKTDHNLKFRHEKFVEYYLANGGNATQAARDAGYSPNPGSLRTLASWLLKKPEIQERIRTRLLEGARVQTDEILGILAHQMRSNLMDVLDDHGQVDLQALRELDLGHLVKKVTIVSQAPPNCSDNSGSDFQEQAHTVKLELQAQSDAASRLGRMLRNQTAAARKRDCHRLVENLCDRFDETLREARRQDSELSLDELFERFAQTESPDYGRNIRLYKQQILERCSTGSRKRQVLARTA
jgi:hypothetical protein